MRGTFRFSLALCLGWVALCSLSACGLRVSKAWTATVEIPQTSVKNQKGEPLCWAYTTNALVESLALRARRGQIDLSESHMALYRIAHILSSASSDVEKNPGWNVDIARISAVNRLKLRGLKEKLSTWVIAPDDIEDEVDAVDLIARYGVVPEADFPVQFDSIIGFSADNRLDKTLDLFLEVWKTKGRALTAQEIVDEVLEKSPAFPVEIPTQVATPDGPKSPREYADYLGFRPQEFEGKFLANEGDLEPILQRIKEALRQGIPVPFNFIPNQKRFDRTSNTWGGEAHEPFDFYGNVSHYILLTDFVNRGDEPGAMPGPLADAATSQPVGELNYLEGKNSWGIDPANGLLRYRLTLAYLQAMMKQNKTVGLRFAVLLPKNALRPTRGE